MKIGLLKNKHVGETAWIVGKGPSLQYLKQSDIQVGPVIALNDAIIKAEEVITDNPIYSMQKDGCGLFHKDHKCDVAAMILPKRSPLFVHEKEAPFCLYDYSPRYVFDNERDFDIPWAVFSSIVAVFIAILMGCVKFVYVSCDACVNGNLDNILGQTCPQYKVQAFVQKKFLESSKIDAEYLTPCA
jgi:hypothetical protein